MQHNLVFSQHLHFGYILSKFIKGLDHEWESMPTCHSMVEMPFFKYFEKAQKNICTQNLGQQARFCLHRMTNGDPKGQIFLSHPHMKNGFFFLLTTVFFFKISFKKSQNKLRCNFTRRRHFNITMTSLEDHVHEF